jgi:hypothetical protein
MLPGVPLQTTSRTDFVNEPSQAGCSKVCVPSQYASLQELPACSHLQTSAHASSIAACQQSPLLASASAAATSGRVPHSEPSLSIDSGVLPEQSSALAITQGQTSSIDSHNQSLNPAIAQVLPSRVVSEAATLAVHRQPPTSGAEHAAHANCMAQGHGMMPPPHEKATSVAHSTPSVSKGACNTAFVRKKRSVAWPLSCAPNVVATRPLTVRAESAAAACQHVKGLKRVRVTATQHNGTMNGVATPDLTTCAPRTEVMLCTSKHKGQGHKAAKAVDTARDNRKAAVKLELFASAINVRKPDRETANLTRWELFKQDTIYAGAVDPDRIDAATARALLAPGDAGARALPSDSRRVACTQCTTWTALSWGRSTSSSGSTCWTLSTAEAARPWRRCLSPRCAAAPRRCSASEPRCRCARLRAAGTKQA